MSGSRPDPAGHLAEQHLGDRLAALVDGELGHDTRERVLAHVATCPKCKAEVDAQRRLKSVFAQAAPPPPSESFLARLQGLPGGVVDGDDSPLGGGGLPGGLSGRSSGVFGAKRGERFEFGYVPARPHAAAPADAAGERGFRIHPVGRGDGERSASRGLRFAFVAAGAVSLAAVALGGLTTGMTGGMNGAEARGGSGKGSNVTPVRTGSAAVVPSSENARRRHSAASSAQEQRASGGAPKAPASMSAPLLPGVVPPGGGHPQDVTHTLTTPVVAGAAAMSPLIRPFTTAPPVSLTSWPTTPGLRAPGPVGASPASPSPSPSASAERLSASSPEPSSALPTASSRTAH
ncbi:membrane protein [Streptomyces sp. F-3]|uniref:Zf-HC2 domain-containing protein n=1 Tax=Streptomyces thermogriseus TaxID=75292 RepID=A0ABP4DNN0_9ACTN|nr:MULTISPECIES: zf-HC2 domain-containing protein [unclassified Streptomyces]MDN5383198.1 zf-HC2 domain-containing protein [Streptomyces sp. LB8]GAT83764.1 membrane protein [Streptomyces sp. F-3]